MYRYLLALLLLPAVVCAEELVDCFYKDNRGVIKITDSVDKVPVEYRESAQCVAAKKQEYVRPNQIDLGGNVRSVSMASPIGRMELRWPRALEKLFGRTPERALADAAKTASRALKSGGFPTHLATIDLTWRIVFLDENLPETQIPTQIVSDCHPGWMYPPADIFIVGQRIAADCAGGQALTPQNADRALTRVLLHEMGHAVEFALLKGKDGNDHFRAEAFASWFEFFAAQHSSIVNAKDVIADYSALGRKALEQGMTGYSFSGTPYDYGLGFLDMKLFVARRGVSGLMRLYETQLANGEMFAAAFRKNMSLSDEKLRQALEK